MNEEESLKIELQSNEECIRNDISLNKNEISQIYLYLSPRYNITFLFIFELRGSTIPKTQGLKKLENIQWVKNLLKKNNIENKIFLLFKF